MDYEKRWEHVKDLGEGGQGRVSLVRDGSLYTLDPLPDSFRGAFLELVGTNVQGSAQKAFDNCRKGILDIVNAESPNNQGALKILHRSQDARDPDRASERIRREIQAMAKTSHPNLLRILDSDPAEKWFVSEFHPNGVLGQHLDNFKGDFPAALRAFRPLVAGVAKLHERKVVHRDIKPANVFLSATDQLVLGDFGLVYFADDKHTRLSGTLENVGTRDWMAPWTMGQKIEDLRPSCDVFSLGKLLWSMISGQAFLRFWYFGDDEFNVERMFPDTRYMTLANGLLRRTIVEREKSCIPNASDLLAEIDRVLRMIDLRTDPFDDNVDRPCRVCGVGTYGCIANRNHVATGNFGLSPKGASEMKIFSCSHCGHAQLFYFPGGAVRPAWDGETAR